MPVEVEIPYGLIVSTENQLVKWIKANGELRTLFTSAKDLENLSDAERDDLESRELNNAATKLVALHFRVSDEFTGMVNMLASSDYTNAIKEDAVKVVRKGLSKIRNIHKNAPGRNNKKVGN